MKKPRIIKIRVERCGDCPNYRYNKCMAGAEDYRSPEDHFYADCPMDWMEEEDYIGDLISRSALINSMNDFALQESPVKEGDSADTYNAIRECIKAVEEISAVEAVPVVHCKDCEHWGTGVAGETEHVKCCEYGKYMVGENGYCCYADMRKKVDNGNFTENGKEL